MRKATINIGKGNWFTRQRAGRLAREIDLLERMDATLWRKTIFCAVLTISGLASAFFCLALLLHVQWGLGLAIPVCVATAAILYVASRYEYGLFWLFTITFVAVIVALIFEGVDIPDIGNVDIPDFGNKKPDRKTQRQAKILSAIAKRKVRLEAALQKL
jgi:hypothetical protein